MAKRKWTIPASKKTYEKIVRETCTILKEKHWFKQLRLSGEDMPYRRVRRSLAIGRPELCLQKILYRYCPL